MIHCRGPVYSDIPDCELKDKIMTKYVRFGVYTTLDTALRLGAQSVVMPLISSNPIEISAKLTIVNTIEWVTASVPGSLKTITICVSDLQAFETTKKYF